MIDSEEEQKKIEEQTEKVNKELEDMDEAAKKRIKNLECEAHRYLWFPDLENGNEVRVGLVQAHSILVSLLL